MGWIQKLKEKINRTDINLKQEQQKMLEFYAGKRKELDKLEENLVGLFQKDTRELQRFVSVVDKYINERMERVDINTIERVFYGKWVALVSLSAEIYIQDKKRTELGLKLDKVDALLEESRKTVLELFAEIEADIIAFYELQSLELQALLEIGEKVIGEEM